MIERQLSTERLAKQIEAKCYRPYDGDSQEQGGHSEFDRDEASKLIDSWAAGREADLQSDITKLWSEWKLSEEDSIKWYNSTQALIKERNLLRAERDSLQIEIMDLRKKAGG